jgi:hypothetical protein
LDRYSGAKLTPHVAKFVWAQQEIRGTMSKLDGKEEKMLNLKVASSY